MAGGLYNRVLARGFPSSVTAGMTGAGALESQGQPLDLAAHGDRSPGAPVPSTLQGFAPEGPASIDVQVLGDTPGPGSATDPDQTPGYGPGTFRTHAAPSRTGWAGGYSNLTADNSGDIETMHANSLEIHGEDFGAVGPQEFYPGQGPGESHIKWDRWQANTPELEGVPNPQVRLTGPQRVLGGMDAVQGYDLRNRFGFDAGHKDHGRHTGNMVMAYLDPAERPFIVPQAAGSFIPTDAVQGPEPWASGLSADDLSYHDPSAYSPPPEPPTLSQPLTEAVAWGW
jgi:hypothetical protein